MNPMERNVPEHIARLMSPEDRKANGVRLMSEIVAEKEVKLERDLHNMFISFLNRHNLGYYHADPSRRSTIAEGMPDFGVYSESRICWIEFKVGKNKLSDVQRDKIATMLADGNNVHLCYSYPEAIEKVSKFFKLNNAK